MRLVCPACGYKMRVLASQQISKELKEVYSDCLSVECGARTVMHVSLSHYVRPPSAGFKHMVSEYLANLSEHERREIFKSSSVKQQTMDFELKTAP